MTQEIDNLDILTACPDCDLIVERVPLEDQQQAHCPRCNNLLYQGRSDHVTKTLIVSATGLLMVFPAYFLPVMDMGALGITNTTSIIESVAPMMTTSFWIAGVSLLLFAIIFPILILGLSFWISFHLRLNLYPHYLPTLQKLFQRLVRWMMSEVYVLGIIVSLVKLLDDFSVTIEAGAISFTLMMFCTVLVTTTVSRNYFWEEAYRHVESK